MPAYDTNNIFAKILRGEFPCHKVYEDEHVLAFLDIMPRAPGHALVVPKARARNILDINPPKLIAALRHRRGRTPFSVSKSPACGGASGVNSQRSGFTSNSGVSS